MTAATPDKWTVVIVSDNEELERLYRLPSDTTIEQISTKWCCDMGIDSFCVFMSVDEKLIYPEVFTLEMIGEALPNSKLINLRIELLNLRSLQPVSTLYLHKDGKCTLVEVEPTTKLKYILSGSRRTYESNGQVLNLNETVAQAGLTNDSVIYEATRNIAVRLSSGLTISINVPRDALVAELMSEVWPFVQDEFSLRYLGRNLVLDENVKEINEVVEVCFTEFSVTIGRLKVKFRMGSGMITFREFISNLFRNCHFDKDVLELLTYCCVGCGRKIFKSEEDFQFLQTKCCRIESLKLIAEWPVSFKDKETQIYITTQNSSTQCGNESKDMGTQTYLHKRNKLTQCEIDKQEKATQIDEMGGSNVTVTSPILIAGYDEMIRDELYLKIDLPWPITTAEVKETVKKHWKWSPDRLLIFREIGSREGRKCVQICNANDVWMRGIEREFGDIAGNSFVMDQVTRTVGDDFEILLDDATIPLFGRKRNIIFANFLSVPFSKKFVELHHACV